MAIPPLLPMMMIMMMIIIIIIFISSIFTANSQFIDDLFRIVLFRNNSHTGVPLQVDELDRSARLAAMAYSWASEIKPYGFYCLIQDCAPGNFYSWIWKILT